MRLTKIYTRTGDQGTTRLANGEEVSKAATRVEAYGDIDELNSLIGLVIAHEPSPSVAEILTSIQHHLFDVGGEIAAAGMIKDMVSEIMIVRLEEAIDRLNADLPPLKEFILPGGTSSAAELHLARTVCRRAERRTIALNQTEFVAPEIMKYLNRLSDLLFVMARYENHRSDNKEVYWKNPQN